MSHITVEHLRTQLTSGNDFPMAFDKFAENGTLTKEELQELLLKAVHTGNLTALQRLARGNPEHLSDSRCLTELLPACCNYGQVDILVWLLEQIPSTDAALINEEPLLSLLIKQMDFMKDKNKCPYFRCMKILLADSRIEIDKTDEKKCTPLHWAVKYKIDHAQELLLSKGAYIGEENIYGELPICLMDPEKLERYLDSCVSSNGKRPGEDDYHVNIDFACLVPAIYKPNCSKEKRKMASNSPYDDEMRPIVRMARIAEMTHILRHPVISSFLILKWLKLTLFFYVNLIACTVFFVSFTSYVVFCYGHEFSAVKGTLKLITIICLLYIIAREFIQMMLHPQQHFLSFENWMELLLIIATCVVLTHEFDGDTRRIASSFVILLSAVEFTLLVGTLPLLSISTHMVMLKRVSANFLKCLVLYAIILIAFALSFYTLFRINNTPSPKQSNGATTEAETAADSDDDQFNRFGDISSALIKTAVMLTGEFEAANIKFQQSSYSYFIFTLFLFFVSIVLFNLMNGLAVSDTAAIKSQSELISISQKVLVIDKYENALKTSRPIGCITRWLFRVFPTNSLQLFPVTIPFAYVTITPNDSNTILIPCKSENNIMLVESANKFPMGKEEHSRLLGHHRKFGINCCMGLPFSHRMDTKVVKNALEILNTRNHADKSTENRIRQIEHNLQVFGGQLEELTKMVQTLLSRSQPHTS